MELTFRSAEGINSAMGRVYAHMMLAVTTSMLVSSAVSSSPALMAFFFTGAMKWLVMFAPLVAVLALSFGIHRLNRTQATAALHVFAAIMGLSFATIFVVYQMGSVISAFMGAAILFAVMSGWGYFTRRDLTSMGQFMVVGLIAIVIASIVNIFIGSSTMQMVLSALAIIVFLGLTAYDTQRIRESLAYDSDTGTAEIQGALSLYLNFINLFLNLLQLFGNKNE